MADIDKREQILSAARRLILRQGLRATSMEAIAAEARVAKPTLYKYFPDKNAVFEAIVAGLMAALHQGVVAALRGEGDVVERVSAALAAKYGAIDSLLEGSPHAAELYDEHEKVRPEVRASEEAIEKLVADELGKAGAKQPELMTRLLLDAAWGIKRKARDPAGVGPGIRLLVERLVGSEVAG
ncbi:TetR/AcrR family transcriptional regulator [Devosia sp. A16]|uniref:TetR/AcrR family transcriptional regulator n=1 Tax=Devosia sp. A16 TaxID=1736675 RepID=UPI0006D7FD17|nr:TetR/AcrR family transcriptional regulator [Devosia sp. A16]